MSEVVQIDTHLVALTKQLLALAKEQRDALQRGTIQQLDWLSGRIEDLIAEVRRASEAEPPSEQEIAALRELATEFEAVWAESQMAVDALNRQVAKTLRTEQ